MYDIHAHALPPTFDPALTVAALRGINQAIYQLIADGMPTAGIPAAEFHANLEGLAYAACYFANQLDAHYREHTEAPLPCVREESPPYIRSPK